MTKKIDIGKNVALRNLFKYAEEVVTEEGNTYYRFPDWFQLLPDDCDIILHVELPEDLSMFICKAGLGINNPKIKKPKL